MKEIIINEHLIVRNGMRYLTISTEYMETPKRANRLAQMGKWNCPNGQMDLPKRAHQYQIVNHIVNQI